MNKIFIKGRKIRIYNLRKKMMLEFKNSEFYKALAIKPNEKALSRIESNISTFLSISNIA